jgi:hypothetical protein
VLRRCSFGGKWCSWITALPHVFLVARVPRQEDPLATLLFVIVMEALGRMIYVAMSGILLSGFSMGTRNVGGIDICHLMFSYRTLIFFGADPNHLRHLSCLFLCFAF